MKAVIQRVAHASVRVDGETVGAIGPGFLVLLGVGQEDTREDAARIAKKLSGLRIFSDAEGKTNLSLRDGPGALRVFCGLLPGVCTPGRDRRFWRSHGGGAPERWSFYGDIGVKNV